MDVNAVIDKVSHRMMVSTSGTIESFDDHYRAVFDTHGFRIDLRGRAGGTVRVSASGLVRGGWPMQLHRDAWRARSNVARRSLAEGVVEQVTATGGRLEWDVVLRHPLSGAGDLHINADVSGPGGVLRQGTGRSSWNIGHGRQLTMGPLVVRDRGGAELYRTMPRLGTSTVSLDVPSAVLQRAAYPLTIDPTVSPEYPVSDPVVMGAGGLKDAPAVAFDGTNYLVVWVDGRAAYQGNPAVDIFGARVSKAGAVLDSTGIPISVAPGDQRSPGVAFDGTNYLVVWADGRSGTGSPAPHDIYGARVTMTGSVLDNAGIPISTAVNDQSEPAVAFDGTNFLVSWDDQRADASVSNIYAARVSKSGAVLEDLGIPVSTALSDETGSKIAFDGSNYLVVWTDGRSGAQSTDIYGARVSKSGAVLGKDIPISTAPSYQERPALAFDGTNFLVVWADGRSDFVSHVYGARVSPASAVLDSGGIPISTAAQVRGGPALAFDGTNYLVVWSDGRSGNTYETYGTRVSTSGTVVGTGDFRILTIAFGAFSPTVAFDGTNSLVVSTSFGAYGSRVSKAGALLDSPPILLSTAANDQTAPSVAFDGTNYLVVWSDNRTNGTFGARVSPSGSILDGSGISIATAAGVAQTQPTVAFDGTNFLVAWTNFDLSSGASDIAGARVSKTGAVLDATPLVISNAANIQFSPALAFDGTNYLVVWSDRRMNTTAETYGARVSTAGSVLDPAGIAISNATGDQFNPSVAFDRTNYLVAWTDDRSGAGNDIYGTRVSKVGTVLDGAGIAISTATHDQAASSVAFDGSKYLVVWTDGRSGGSNDIYGARVSKTATLLDSSGIAISTAPGNQDEPAVVGSSAFLVVWRDRRSSTKGDIYGARVGDMGSVNDGAGIAIATDGSDESDPAVAVGPSGRFSVAYQRFTPEAPYGSNRVFLRTVAPK